MATPLDVSDGIAKYLEAELTALNEKSDITTSLSGYGADFYLESIRTRIKRSCVQPLLYILTP